MSKKEKNINKISENYENLNKEVKRLKKRAVNIRF